MAEVTIDISVVIPVYNERDNVGRGGRAGPPCHGRHGASLRAPLHRRRQHRRHLGRAPARPRRASRTRRPSASARTSARRRRFGRLPPCPGRGDRHHGRRPPERPGGHPPAARQARRGLRHRQRVAAEPPGPVPQPPPAVDHRQPAHLLLHRRPPARLRLHAQGLPARGGQAPEALRRDAPLHPGHRLVDGGQRRRGRGRPPSAHDGASRNTASSGRCGSSST